MTSLTIADENDIPGILFFADFEKAFDTIEHNFIYRALKYFKFGNDIIPWMMFSIKTFQVVL